MAPTEAAQLEHDLRDYLDEIGAPGHGTIEADQEEHDFTLLERVKALHMRHEAIFVEVRTSRDEWQVAAGKCRDDLQRTEEVLGKTHMEMSDRIAVLEAALAATERRLVRVYRASAPGGNYGDENQFADQDEVVQQARSTLDAKLPELGLAAQ